MCQCLNSCKLYCWKEKLYNQEYMPIYNAWEFWLTARTRATFSIIKYNIWPLQRNVTWKNTICIFHSHKSLSLGISKICLILTFDSIWLQCITALLTFQYQKGSFYLVSRRGYGIPFSLAMFTLCIFIHGSRTTAHGGSRTTPTRTTPTRTNPHQDNSPLGQLPTRTIPH